MELESPSLLQFNVLHGIMSVSSRGVFGNTITDVVSQLLVPVPVPLTTGQILLQFYVVMHFSWLCDFESES